MTDDSANRSNQFALEVVPKNIEDKMRSSYLDYAMSVIVSRALPDVRDGMKPVHRRILYAMRQAGNDHNKPYKKSARIVGDVLGKFHPHSQDAVYDSIVRMAQDFSLRYLLVDGQGNFGSVDGDEPAAMRYTEIRMTRLAHQMMADIDKETVDMMPNYDGSEEEPTVLTPNFPALMVNGSSGIAVGMATNIPPHNLNEVIDGCLLLLANPDATIKDLMKKIKAPDFPTAGIIHGVTGVKEAYETGNGRVVMRGRIASEQVGRNKREALIITELPYTVNKATMIEHIAELVRDKRLVGISDLRDESDRHGMRVVIELKRDAQPAVLENNLYKMTELQRNFSVNTVALVHGVPKVLNLKQLLQYFLEHRVEVVYRRSLFALERAREKAHNLEGLAVAISNVEEVIAIIKNAPSPAEAKTLLLAREWKCKTVEDMIGQLDKPELARPTREPGAWGLHGKGGRIFYRLSERQAQTILDMRLARLTAIERDKIITEYAETYKQILNFLDILDKPERINSIIVDELTEIKGTFGDKRRSKIDKFGGDIDDESLIDKVDMVVTISHNGYIKAHRDDEYRSQHRGGGGSRAAGLKDGDYIADLHHANTHDMMLFFTSRGRIYWNKVYQIPTYTSHNSWGKPIVNLLPLVEGEKIQAVLTVSDLNQEGRFVVMATRNGIIKKTPLKAFANPRSKGIHAINIDDGDGLVGAALATVHSSIMLFSDSGKAVRFPSKTLRPLSRTARGVKGINLGSDANLVSLVVVDDETKAVLTVTEQGQGKLSAVADYPIKSRGTKGVVNISRNSTTGKIVKCVLTDSTSDFLVVTNTGRLIRSPVNKVRQTSRNTKGVKVMRISHKDGEVVTDVSKIVDDVNGKEQGALLDGGAGSKPGN